MHPKTPEETKEWVEKLFSQKGSIDHKAVSYVSKELTRIRDYFANVNEHSIKGMSLFIVVDSVKEEYLVKLIDLVSMTHIDQENGPARDDGVTKGCNSLIDLIGEI